MRGGGGDEVQHHEEEGEARKTTILLLQVAQQAVHREEVQGGAGEVLPGGQDGEGGEARGGVHDQAEELLQEDREG